MELSTKPVTVEVAHKVIVYIDGDGIGTARSRQVDDQGRLNPIGPDAARWGAYDVDAKLISDHMDLRSAVAAVVKKYTDEQIDNALR